MGVYNPNMEMPRNCTECFEFKDDCEHYWDYYCTHESRPNTCPLIEIDDKEMNGLINLYKICKGTSEVKSIQLKDIKPIVF